MPSDVNTFRDLELLNVRIDVWIDEEDYDEVYNCITLGIKSKVKTAIEEAFRDSSKFKSIFINEKGKDSNPQNAIQITDINNAEKKEKWKPLFFSKYLRAKIQEDGTDDYTKHLEDLVTYLQRKLPYPYPDPKNYQEIILQHLYYQELSACGKPGLESLGFAVQAYHVWDSKDDVSRKDTRSNLPLYKLWARLNQGIGYWHSNQKREAAQAFDEIISISRGFEDASKCKEEADKRVWASLILDQAILFKAEVQEDSQFSYHTLQTLGRLNNSSKRERRFIKEALAYCDMGRLDAAKAKIKELLSYDRKKDYDSVSETFQQFKGWENRTNKISLGSQILGLLFDYYLQEFQETEGKKQADLNNDVENLANNFIDYMSRSLSCTPDRRSYYQQAARFLEWLSSISKRDKDQKHFFDDQVIRLYHKIRKKLPGLTNGQQNLEGGKEVTLREFGRYEYDRFTNSMEKFFRNINTVKRDDKEIDFFADEIRFLDALNNFEQGNHWLYSFKELERKQRKDSLVTARTNCGKRKPFECFHSGKESRSDSSAFDGVLKCAEKNKNRDSYLMYEYYNLGFKPMMAGDYEKIMNRENERFLDYLKFKSKHKALDNEPISYHFLGLQRWNSQTPTLTLSQGGGYFIYQQDGKGQVVLGIAIDPGFDFVDNLFHMGFTLYDIDFILISHAHLDHMRDFEPIISSLLDLKKRTYGNIKKKIHVMMSLGVYHKLEHVITNTTLREYLADTYIIDIDKKIGKEYLPPFRFKKDTMDDRSRKFVSVLDNEDSIWEIEITPTKAYHNDYSEESDSFGYIIRFMGGDWKKPLFSFGYTGDTKWHKSIPGQYSSCDVICIHLGALIESEKEKDGKDRFSYYMGSQCEALIEKKGHPYLFGLLRFLKQIKETKNQNKLILISEFGEELKGGIRIDLIRRLNHILEDQDRVCLPVDIGLNLILAKKKNGSESGVNETPNLVWCFGCERFVKAGKIGYKHFGYGRDEALFYFCETCLKSKPQNVIQDKMRLICEQGIPLQKANQNHR